MIQTNYRGYTPVGERIEANFRLYTLVVVYKFMFNDYLSTYILVVEESESSAYVKAGCMHYISTYSCIIVMKLPIERYACIHST